MDKQSKVSPGIVGVLALVGAAALLMAMQRTRKNEVSNCISNGTQPLLNGKIVIIYGTTTGTAKAFAHKLSSKLMAAGRTVEVANMATYDQEKLVKENIVLYICSTWEGGVVPESCSGFLYELKDYAHDFRVSKDLLEKIQFAVFGLGGELYGNNFGKAALEIDECMSKLGASALSPVVLGDDASNLEERFGRWSAQLYTLLTGKTQDAASFNEDGATSKRQLKRAQRAQEVNEKKRLEGKNKTTVGSTAAMKAVKAATKAVEKQNKSNGCCQTNSNSTSKNNTAEEGCCGGSSKASKNTTSSNGCGCKETSTEVNSNTLGLDPRYVSDDEEEEEDLINNNYVTMDHVPDEEERAEELHRLEKEGLLDLEDMGNAVNASNSESQQHKQSVKDALRDTSNSTVERREMVTKLQRKALTKEGYKIIGTHSAVKICRWTKNQLRGRGGCYKHSFYGITSYQCMEATPSLACANKCVFCWRHHKNPVGTEWRWKEDAPDMIVSEAVRLHQGMINEMRGVPGVQTERLQEAFTVRHCALSLVGEPIMYPRINEMLAELHKRDISSFMVTNAQFPDSISNLDPVTQLYVSVDASTRDSLKAIDRPLFRDFWERFISSLEELKRKQQRTVYRMTLVKSWNMDEAEGYADLIEAGQPDFIEIKAMTYCGKSDASSLTMQNVPWHTEVCAYGDALCERLAQRGVLPFRYNIATEHEHSCCILLAREDKFKPNGVWHTWIDYDRFHMLMRKYYESNGKETFTSRDYIAETPYWALYKSATRGFDPEEQRWHRNKTTGALVEIPYEASESGCG